jgi:phosphoglycolate phosphatase
MITDNAHMETDMVCPICRSGSFEDYRNVPNTRCRSCKSNERTRVAKLFLDRHVRLRPGQKVLHFAPEPQLGKQIVAIVGAGYEAADIDPGRYTDKLGYRVQQLDLCTDAKALPSDFYDLILHNHVMEHVPCNVTLVLQNLHRAVKPGGAHMFSIPVLAGHSAEDLDPALTEAERTARFSQRDHIRRFGRADFDLTVGAVFGLTASYSLTDFFSEADLRKSNIRESQWVCSGSSVFYLRK